MKDDTERVLFLPNLLDACNHASGHVLSKQARIGISAAFGISEAAAVTGPRLKSVLLLKIKRLFKFKF